MRAVIGFAVGPLCCALAAMVLAGCTGRESTPVADETTEPTASEPAASAEPTAETAESTETTATPVAPRPAVGDCRKLAWEDTGRAVTDAASEPVDCEDATGQTFLVGRLADRSVSTDGSVDVDAVARSSATACRVALVDWLGGTEADYELSMMAYVVGVPTASDVAAGARWFRCDTFGTVRDGELAPLPRTTEGLLADDGVQRWAACVDGELGPAQQQVLCVEPHNWRGISAFRLGARGDKYPGDAAVLGETRDQCASDVRAWVDDPLESFDYGWLRPTRETWAEGQRFVLCFAKTTE